MVFRKCAVIVISITLSCVFAFGCRPSKAPTARPRPHKGASISLFKVPKGKSKRSKDVVVLRRDTLARFAKNGAATLDYRMQVKLLTKAGVRGWQFFTASWSPWYEHRPRLTVRIKLPDGKTLELDQSTINVETARASSYKEMTDRKRLRAPLPGLVVGAVIHLRLVQREKRPRLGSGDLHRISFAPLMPTKVHHLTIESPVSLPLKWEVRGLSLKPRSDQVSGGIRRVVFKAGPFEKNPLWEFGLPPEAARYPHVQISTVKRWRDVASVYHKFVKARLRSPGAAAVVAKLRRAGATGRLRIIAALLSRLRKKIRYTALSLSEGAIQPRKPDVTLKRGYGDCKDMSALLVAWLHAAGIKAHMALVNTSGADVRPGLPGLAAFNHAIVHIPGAKPLWIDPTARYTTPQVTAGWVQNRYSLIVTPKTTAVVRIPATKAADNIYEEVRRVRFTPQSGGHVVEETRSTGLFEARIRRMVGNQEPGVLRKSMKAYISRSYSSSKLVSIRHGKTKRLDQRFRFRLELKKAQAAWTDDHKAKMDLNTGLVWSDVPYYLKYAPKPGSKAFKRKRDFYWSTPHESKVTYHLSPPPEYVLASGPESGSYALGPARITWTVQHVKKTGRLKVVIHFKSGPRRYRPSDVKAFWRGMRKFSQAVKISKVIYEHRGRKLHKEGKYAAALAVYQSLVKRWPNNSAYYRQLGNFHLDTGFGQKAREVMRLAVKRLPRDAVTHFNLGIYLEHDLYGNQSLHNWDRKATIATYRRAQQLDPKNAYYPLALGRVLSMDKHGDDLTTAHELKPALKVLLDMRKKLKDKSMDNRIARLLLYSRRHEELRRHLRLLSAGGYRNSMSVASHAVEKGFRAGVALARRLAPEERKFKGVVTAAGLEVLRLSEYDLSKKLLLLGIGDGLKERARARSIKQIRSMRHLAQPARTAKQAALQLFYLAYSGKATAKRINQLVVKRMSPEVRKTVIKSLGEVYQLMRRGMRNRSDYPPKVVTDMALCQFRPKIKGNDRLGYRVDLAAPGRRSKFTVYVVKSGGKYRVLTVGIATSEIGREALALIKKGRVAEARKWLDWERGSTEAPSDLQRGRPFDHLYVAGKKASKKRLRLAATVLAARNDKPDKRLVRSLEGFLRRPPSKADRLQIERALMWIYYNMKRFGKAARLAGRLMKKGGNKRSRFMLHQSLLLAAGKTREAGRNARKWQRDQPTQWQSYFSLARVDMFRGKYKASLKQLKRAAALANAPSRVFNLSAWVALFVQPMPAKAGIQDALKAVRMSNYSASHILHTLATLYAETGELHSARLALVKAMELNGRRRPKDSDFYPYGRIAEQLGHLDVAVAYYRKVKKPKRLTGTDTWILAQRRLKILKRNTSGRTPKKR